MTTPARARQRPRVRAWAGAGWLACALAAPGAPAMAGGGYVAGALEDRVDLLVRDGYDHPARALAQLAQLRAATSESPATTRLFVQAQASIEAQAGRVAEASALAERLLALSREQPDPLAGAASNLVRAEVAETAGQLDVAAALAQSALSVYESGCPRPPAVASASASHAAGAAPSVGECDYRSQWRALQLMERRAVGLAQMPGAHERAQAAFDVADAAGDTYRKALALGTLAYIVTRSGQPDLGLRAIAQAKRMAASTADPVAMARVRLNEARAADQRGDADGGLRVTEEAYVLAQRAGAQRLAAVLLGNLSDSYVQRGRPADALRAVAEALPTVREFNDLRAERVLINNAGLAKIGLHRIAEGKQDLARVLELWTRSGQIGDQAQSLREFGQALAAAGDARGALELYHRERALSAEVMQRNRSLVLKEMQTRYDAESKQRSIDLMRSDNALKTAALANRDLMQRIWLLAAAVMALSMVLAALLYRRVRETHRQLADSHAKLRVASERDPLTDLANRRHFHAVMQALDRSPGGGFAGALLLVDIDHFKHINDGHGHAAGDMVLVEIARRLRDAVRDDDLVVRWGGEEFLILAARLGTEQTDQLAARVLASVGGSPIAIENQALRVTASIGYACFPLPPYSVSLQWEQAVNLVDMALYTAKSQGRNCAVGLASASASDAPSLRAIESDFERAWHEGRVSLRQTAGPRG